MIVLIVSRLLPSMIFLRKVLDQSADQVAAILISDRLLVSNYLELCRYAAQMITCSGWVYSSYMASLWLEGQAFSKSHRKVRSLLNLHNIPVYSSKDFNNSETIEYLNQLGCDRYLSYYCDQIFQAKTIENLRAPLYNVHPSLLPNYRGIDPVFQQLVCQEKDYGVTLHKIEAKIDAGPIVLQKKLAGSFFDHFSLLKESSLLAAELANYWIEKNNQEELNQDELRVRAAYRSWPSRKEVQAFLDLGYRFRGLGQ